MRITSVECHVLLVPDVKEDAASSAQDDFIVEVHTDEGITGVGEARDSIVPYASLQPDASGFDAYRAAIVDWAARAREEYGFRAAKLELTFDGPYAHRGMHEPDSRVVEVAEAVRRRVGPEMTLMVDVQYAWSDAERAIRTARGLKDVDIFFLETPLWTDDLDGYARLHHAGLGVRIAAGE